MKYIRETNGKITYINEQTISEFWESLDKSIFESQRSLLLYIYDVDGNDIGYIELQGASKSDLKYHFSFDSTIKVIKQEVYSNNYDRDDLAVTLNIKKLGKDEN